VSCFQHRFPRPRPNKAGEIWWRAMGYIAWIEVLEEGPCKLFWVIPAVAGPEIVETVRVAA